MVLLLGLLAASSLVINEVYYDPPGPDGGAEFVEIFNPAGETVSLAGARLEFANGAGEVRWLVRWQADPADSLASGGCFLVVDAGWQGVPAQAVVSLQLQNGPDAVRLVRPDGTVDVVGWGDLVAAELYEEAPAPDVSGLALARRPDGHDTDDNDADLEPAGPTPGALNWPEFAPRLAAWSWQPPVLEAPDLPLLARLEIRNEGRADLQGHHLRLDLGEAWVEITLPATAPDSSASLSLQLSPGRAGAIQATARFWSTTAADTVWFDLGQVQVGPADLQLSEVMAAPASGGEWCEIVNSSPVPRSLADLKLRDEDGAWRDLPDLALAPGDCLVLAQDAAALTDWLGELARAGVAQLCDPDPPVSLPGWPSLNNTAPGSRNFADRLYLATATGTVIDYVTLGLGSGRAPEGRSLERQRDRRWRPATAPAGGTPGCLPPVPVTVVPGEVRLVPNPFSRDTGDGAVHVHLLVPPDAVGYEVRFYDLWGRQVRDLGGDDLGPGTREAIWDGRDEGGEALPPGGYVAVVLWRQASGVTRLAARRLVVLREVGS